MVGDPKKTALLILAKGKEKGAPKESEDAGSSEGEASGSGVEALRDMFRMGSEGDYAGAFDALRMAVTACEGDD